MDTALSSVLAAADRLVEAFGRHDTDGYFAAFSPDASFIFHNLDRVLKTRDEYRDEWLLWEERDGFRVKECRSSERDVRLSGDVAIFTHRVETTVEFGGDPATSVERETIVFERTKGGDWLAIHEHLSKMP